MIVRHPHYAGMPGAVVNEKIVWQCSSGKATSFYEYYLGRVDWWTKCADKLGLSGVGKQNDRWTTAARMIHPTGVRACLVCGESKQIGYYYANQALVNWLQKNLGVMIAKADPIDSILMKIEAAGKLKAFRKAFDENHAERENELARYGLTPAMFKATQARPSRWLSPGFMGNPPYRLDGIHDYCTTCRKGNDPGRSDSNMQSYFSDRRAYERWSEGKWSLADSLYSKAGPGKCDFCGKDVTKVSPDHLGPLACGFKHVPIFQPLCSGCQSSKNRRMRKSDVDALIAYEKKSGESSASWYVDALWQKNKLRVKNDDDAAELSAALRAMQDLFFRALFMIWQSGHPHYLATLLRPDEVLSEATFVGLNPADFSYERIEVSRKDTLLRRNKRMRVVRVSFEALADYNRKPREKRKLRPDFFAESFPLLKELQDMLAKEPPSVADMTWIRAVSQGLATKDEQTDAIEKLLPGMAERSPWEQDLHAKLVNLMSVAGNRLIV
ncbi:MAG: hypothetical protein AABY18_04730 [Candidatus Thermoplasmatota archaeon]